ncbi:cytochrome P450 4c21-like [Contarinia nasturtii]|uniref:cytochrome P450 4c21-like n=1 Tax=Contarinia nasturtii TaxID=265458 RepID=UPI0012D46C49|nr:cytochrome P450 4c21-like [Contarinia nasturtii]
MLLFRFYLLVFLVVLAIWWPIKFLVSWFLYKRRATKLTKNILKIDDYPLVGCGFRFMGKNNEEILDTLKDLCNNKTPFVGWFGPQSFVVIDHPDEIQTVMNAKGCIEKSLLYNFFNRGIGLFAAPAAIYKVQRKQLAASFSNPITWSFLPIFNQKANSLVRNVSQHVGKGHFDIMHLSSCCTLDIVCESVLGTNMKIQDGENLDYMEALAEWLSAVARRMVNIFLHPDFIYKLTQSYQIECNWSARSSVMPKKMISEKMKEFYENNNVDAIDDDENNQKIERPQIFINRLMKLHSKGLVTDQEIRDQVDLIIFGGHDTSAFTAAVTILMLAMHSKVEQRVMDELNDVLGDHPADDDLTMDQINQMTYLEQVIRETLRLYPVAPVLLRHCTEDTEVENYVVPAGSEVIISAITAHRRKDIWGPDADEFNPDHFSKEEMAKRSPYAFMAFSNGTRYCLGQRFAFISIKVVLAKLIRKYRITTHLGMDDIKFRFEVTCKPINGIMVEVEERK